MVIQNALLDAAACVRQKSAELRLSGVTSRVSQFTDRLARN